MQNQEKEKQMDYSRVIKFRAWDKKGKEMFTPIMLSFPYGENRVIVSGRGGTTDTENDDCILMQFTGLLDRHGKEIYEGDILRLRTVEGSPFPVDAVEVHWSKKKQCWLPKVAEDITCWEVIGNIYENPELINTK